MSIVKNLGLFAAGGFEYAHRAFYAPSVAALDDMLASVRERLDNHEYNYIHIATHGPTQVVLETADGTAIYYMATLDLLRPVSVEDDPVGPLGPIPTPDNEISLRRYEQRDSE